MDRTDPRYLRSRRSLRLAVLDLARSEPLSSISVAAVCRRSGVTRDTFYRHATSPVDLLADTLADALDDAFGPERDEHGALRLETGFRHAERTLLTHVAEHADVYRNAMQPRLAAPVRENLERFIRDLLVSHLRRYPATLPPGLPHDDEVVQELVAQYSAAGTVGAVEVWLAHEPLDVDRGVDLVVKASPAFWFRSTGEVQ